MAEQRNLAPGGAVWVSGEKFFNRERETADLIRKVEQGSHILMTGQRRMGKTSIAHQLTRILRERNPSLNHLFVDLDDCVDEVHMIVMIAEQVAALGRENQSLVTWAKRYWEKFPGFAEISIADFTVKLQESMTNATWREHGDELLQSLSGAHRTLITIDELPNMLLRIEANGGKDRVEGVLRWLRRNCQAPSTQGLQFMVSGSIGLIPMVRRLSLVNSISQFEEYRIGPWTRQVANDCLEARARYDEITYEPGAIDEILNLLGILVPFHIQRFSTRCADLVRSRDNKTVSLQDVATLYKQMVDGDEYQLDHYESRLRESLGEDFKLSAQPLLNACADGEARSFTACKNLVDSNVSDEDLVWLLGLLVHDGYLVESNENWSFPSGILRDWWVKVHRLQS